VPLPGIIGWVSPLTAAGIDPVSRHGLVRPGPVRCFERCTHTGKPTPLQRFWSLSGSRATLPNGTIAYGPESAIAEYDAAQSIQHQALAAAAKVVAFPELLCPPGRPATDAFWQQTLDRLRSSGKTVLIGARVPLPSHKTFPVRYDFSADLTARNGKPRQMVPVISRKAEPVMEPVFAYDKAAILRGAEVGMLKQRSPVPVARWNPVKTAAARLNLWGAGVIDVHGQRAAILICYEQPLNWCSFL
jgi:hypothetical protein